MKIAFVGFNIFSVTKHLLQELVVEQGHEIVDDKQAEVLIVPHHLDKLFPTEKPWIAVWIQGGSARLMALSILENKPQEVIAAFNTSEIELYQGNVLIETLERISQNL